MKVNVVDANQANQAVQQTRGPCRLSEVKRLSSPSGR